MFSFMGYELNCYEVQSDVVAVGRRVKRNGQSIQIFTTSATQISTCYSLDSSSFHTPIHARVIILYTLTPLRTLRSGVGLLTPGFIVLRVWLLV
jgi:hypothetical protein